MVAERAVAIVVMEESIFEAAERSFLDHGSQHSLPSAGYHAKIGARSR
jgi:hypothetical protein